jgi:hypothetical protein
MALEERDPHTGYTTTGHEWNGIKELNTHGAAARILSNEADNPIVKVQQPNSSPEIGDEFLKN